MLYGLGYYSMPTVVLYIKCIRLLNTIYNIKAWFLFLDNLQKIENKEYAYDRNETIKISVQLCFLKNSCDIYILNDL